MEHILAAIDNIVNGEVNLPPGDQTKLFERIREVGKGYTIIGTKYTYNSRNQLVHREDLTRDEEYDYTYDEAGNLLSDGRSKYEWNARGQLTKVTFPDGFGESYASICWAAASVKRNSTTRARRSKRRPTITKATHGC